jgi:outer membrane immunogenic protein
MFIRRLTLAVAGIALACSVPASAADLRHTEYPPHGQPSRALPVFTWQGAYFGAHGTYIRRNHGDHSDNNAGVFGGLQVGYNHVLAGSSLTSVIGAELEGDYLGRLDAEDRAAGSPDQRWLAAAKLRYGIAFDRTLLFVTGGFATTRIANKVDGRDDDTWKPGYLLGAGIEYAVTDTISVKAEYNYVRFGDWKGTSLPGFLEKSDLTNHIAKAGVNYHF